MSGGMGKGFGPQFGFGQQFPPPPYSQYGQPMMNMGMNPYYQQYYPGMWGQGQQFPPQMPG